MTTEERKVLLELARNAVKEHLGLPFKEPEIKGLEEKRGAFVTLNEGKDLRGCIGYIIGIKPLYKQIPMLAVEAAFADPRFPPVRKEEYSLLSFEISILSVPRTIAELDEFVLHRDGIILTVGSYRAVFLPQVADETGWSKQEMLDALSRKAGLPADAWKSRNAIFQTFTAEVFS
ncbi:MAG: AmmeMemoRadiSam system protein A [Spirochaetia bacterium]|jgi:AmmeMemoRadiSam system protein A|nr:AmmeMemoRadiSam system protein A [Spirochaetia bacterium]